MSWSTVRFGKHEGKTLPQIIFSDPDWFFWALESDVFKGKGSLQREAADLAKKATVIRIPNNKKPNRLVAEYCIHHPTGKFSHMKIVRAEQPEHEGSSPTFRSDVIDLSVPRRIASYDKLGCKNMISSAKHALFGSKTARMTKDRCESFFDDTQNFAI